VVGGNQVFVDPAYICGSIGSAASTSANATGLKNGTYYTVAIAGIDNYGNTGPLSTPACNTPQEVIDFWQTYRDDGGQAGGGFCSVRDLGSPATAAPVIVFGAWAILTVLRRRRERK
jgi:hypothetical protein